jgi:hypothetical protein
MGNSLCVVFAFTPSAEEEPSCHETDQDAANSASYGRTCECSRGVAGRAILAGRS